MAQAVVVELSQTSAKERHMGEESLLSHHRRPDVEVCGAHRDTELPWAVFMETTALRREYTDTTTPEDQRGGQSLRSAMAYVFRGKREGFDGTISCCG